MSVAPKIKSLVGAVFLFSFISFVAGSRLSTMPPFEVDPEKDVSYINLTLLDVSRAVEMGVREKIREKADRLPFPVVRRILKREKTRDKLASLAGKRVKPGTVARELAAAMPKQLMYKMHQKMGMKVAARTTFVEDAYVVIEFQVKHVDAEKLLARVRENSESGGEETNPDDDDDEVPPEVLDAWIEEMEAAEEGSSDDTNTVSAPPIDDDNNSAAATTGTTWTGWIAGHLEYATRELLPTRYKESLENDSLPSKVQAKITDAMAASMERKLASKHLEAEIAVLHSESQARYFYANLEAVRERRSRE